MIKYVTGNLLSAEVEALVNTVNTVGVMGKGIALQFKESYTENYKIYHKACKANEVITGKMLVTATNKFSGPQYIINFPTKTDWRKPSEYSYIEEGLKDLVKVISGLKLNSIAIPPLGCGNGGLNWDQVKIMMESALSQLPDVEVLIFQPDDNVKQLLKQQESKKEVKLTAARAMLLYSLFYYEGSGEPASVFVANKLAYFIQRSGENLKLKFTAHHYGPYSPQVEHVLYALNGKYLKGLEQREAKPFEPLIMNYETLDEVKSWVSQQLTPDQRQRLQSVLKLVDGFQSALSLEILATVDFLSKENPSLTIDEIYSKIEEWSERKKQLIKKEYVSIAKDHLENHGQQMSFA
jgi:O-acetyl-ADP-ribose deacetylase (regulator of RNase III)/uncharacterized protein YwgA